MKCGKAYVLWGKTAGIGFTVIGIFLCATVGLFFVCGSKLDNSFYTLRGMSVGVPGSCKTDKRYRRSMFKDPPTEADLRRPQATPCMGPNFLILQKNKTKKNHYCVGHRLYWVGSPTANPRKYFQHGLN